MIDWLFLCVLGLLDLTLISFAADRIRDPNSTSDKFLRAVAITLLIIWLGFTAYALLTM